MKKIDLNNVLVLKNYETSEVKFYCNLIEANNFCKDNPEWGLKGEL